MTALAEAGFQVAPGYGPEDAYPVTVEDRGTRCDHRASDGTTRLPVDCAGRIEPGDTYVLVRHGFRLGMPVRLDCLLIAGVLTELPPCGHRDIQRGCGGCDPGAIEFVIDDAHPRVLRAPRPDDFTRRASTAALTGAHAHEEDQ